MSLGTWLRIHAERVWLGAACCLAVLLLAHAAWIGVSYIIHFRQRRRAGDAIAISLTAYARAWLWEVWYASLLSLTFAFGALPQRRPRRFDAAAGPPIVLVHGYLMNRACMQPLARRLRKQGYRNIYSLDLRPMFGSIERLGARAIAQLEIIAAHCEGVPMVAVCHSMGGLVMRWCANLRPDLPLAKIICLASPHQGTSMALLALGQNGLQMRPSSALLATLAPKGVPVVSIYSELDNVIMPARSAAFGTEVRFEHCGHAGVLYDKRVFVAVLQAIRGAQEGVPAPAESAVHVS